MNPFPYTPYAEGKTPFSIGLAPLDPESWIEVDDHLPRYLAEKDNLFASDHHKVFRAHNDTRDAQREATELIIDHLVDRHPHLYAGGRNGIDILPTGTFVDPEDYADRPLEAAARLIQDDLVLMRQGEAGYDLVAGAVCFPSSWSLEEKFGLSLDAIHEPVPGYAGKMARRMNLIFDRLPEDQIVWRTNWSIYGNDTLPSFRAGNEFSRDGEAFDFDSTFLRVERQTLRRLSGSKDILFTIMIYIDPMTRLKAHPDRKALADGLRQRVLELNSDELAYKALAGSQQRLADYLEAIAEGQ